MKRTAVPILEMKKRPILGMNIEMERRTLALKTIVMEMIRTISWKWIWKFQMKGRKKRSGCLIFFL
jgi:hypothetical protein